ncbi:MAG TPA: hypothetical protein VG274_11840 [Rhizomicrobium sp.]|nr:hypothetical protein [Rhizomicrobium sp.]
MGQSIEPQSPEQRIVHYRDMAMEVIRLSGETHSAGMKAQFLQLAQSWLALADEVARNIPEAEATAVRATFTLDATLPA